MLCSQCQHSVQMVYRVPARHLRGPRAPTALCYFCFLRMVGRKPTRADRVTGEP
jgi:hypothetical protein